jgi:DNA-binding GntR family transcriptional regulator
MSPNDSWERPPALVEDIQQHLRQSIFNGRYPPGTRLRQEQLAEELNVSRTPLREALRVLQNEGILTSSPGRSVVVASASLDDLLAACQFREAVEGVAARLAAEGPGAELRPQLEERLERQVEVAGAAGWDKAAFMKRDADFHVAILESTENKYLRSQVPLVRMATQVFGPLLGFQQPDADRAILEHRRIAEAIYEGDGVAAELWARGHIRVAITAVSRAQADQAKAAGSVDGDEA